MQELLPHLLRLKTVYIAHNFLFCIQNMCFPRTTFTHTLLSVGPLLYIQYKRKENSDQREFLSAISLLSPDMLRLCTKMPLYIRTSAVSLIAEKGRKENMLLHYSLLYTSTYHYLVYGYDTHTHT